MVERVGVDTQAVEARIKEELRDAAKAAALMPMPKAEFGWNFTDPVNAGLHLTHFAVGSPE